MVVTVIDHCPVYRHGLVRALEEAGYSVDGTAPSGELSSDLTVAVVRSDEDRRRVGDDFAVLRDEDGNQPLPAHRLDRRAVARVDVDPSDLEALVPGGERDAFDVGGERDPVDPDQIHLALRNHQSCIAVVTRITPQTYR